MSESEPQMPNPAPVTSDAAGSITAGNLKRESGARAGQSRFEVSQEPVTGEEASSGGPHSGPAPAYEHLGDLPATYGTQSVYLVAYDPRQLFAYWDVEPAGGVAYGLRICRADGEVESEVEIQVHEPGRYLPAAVSEGTYYVELGATFRGSHWRPLAYSGRVTMPPPGLAGESEPKFATLPFHLSFQRAIELIRGAMAQGEELTEALSRLQRGDSRNGALLLDALTSLSREQMQTLERLLGQRINLSSEAGGSFGGSEAGSMVGGPLPGSESLSSAGMSSETLSSGGSERLASAYAAMGSESLSSGALQMGSESLSSGALRLASEIFFSGTLAGKGESLSSGMFGLSSESLSSLESALSSLGWGASGAGASGGSFGLAGRFGPSSEAWRLAATGKSLSSETLTSQLSGSEALASGAMFFRDLGSHVDSLTAVFSAVFEHLSSELLSSESASSSAVFSRQG